LKTQNIPFNKPYMTGKELHYISQAHFGGMLAGDGPFTKKCHQWLEEKTETKQVLLTHSCTAALEMAAILINTSPGDEIIMPSFTFVSTANAFVLRGGVPVFVDIRKDTLNIDEKLIEAAITPRTKAIVPVHYAGVACEMDSIMAIAIKYHLRVVEDAAQGVMATYKGRQLGSIGDLGAYSFHETKNVISGEGGALLTNDPAMILRAEIIREKGTDRSSFFRGEKDKYTWQEVGSSFLPGELTAAFLWAQLEEAELITTKRMEAWEIYHNLLAPLEDLELLRRPIIPEYCQHNAHMYYVLLPKNVDRHNVLKILRKRNISPVFHYVPLHTSPAGQRYGKKSGDLKVTEQFSSRLIRLPLWIGLEWEQQERIVGVLKNAITGTI
jgi:dTDP-4-amino-4,6-dideoxygalactose transaminase